MQRQCRLYDCIYRGPTVNRPVRPSPPPTGVDEFARSNVLQAASGVQWKRIKVGWITFNFVMRSKTIEYPVRNTDTPRMYFVA